MNNNEELKKIIKDFKNFDGDILDKSLFYLADIGYLEFGIGEVEVCDNPKEGHDELNDIFEWIENGNAKLLIRLNNLLEEKDKDKDIIKLEEKMNEIQAKRIISVREFTKIYNYSSDWQKNRRSRIKDRLPFIQVTENGKITYNVKDIEIWFENNNIQF